MNLNKIKKYLKGWFEESPFINTVEVSTKDDFAEINNINYPVVHIEYLNTSTSSAFSTYTFIITIADIQNSKIKHNNIDEIHNDCQLIAQDFIDFHSAEFTDFELDENIQITPFEEANTDRTAGVTFAVRLNVHREKDTCIQPNKHV